MHFWSLHAKGSTLSKSTEYLLPGCEPKKNFALLIDGDNMTCSKSDAEDLLKWAGKFGNLRVKRVFCAAGTQHWLAAAQRHQIERIQCAGSTGKNDVDIAIALVAGQLSSRTNLDGFILVSSDGDFCQIASFLNQSPHDFEVHGLGRRAIASPSIGDVFSSYTYMSEIDSVGRASSSKGPSCREIQDNAIVFDHSSLAGVPSDLIDVVGRVLNAEMIIGDVQPFGGAEGADPLVQTVHRAVASTNSQWVGVLKGRTKLVVASLKNYAVSQGKSGGKHWITRLA